MGYYIQTPRNLQKVMQLQELYGATVDSFRLDWTKVPEDKAVIVVINNGLFEAAGLAYSEDEYKEFMNPDGRRKTVMLMDKFKAYELSGYKPRTT